MRSGIGGDAVARPLRRNTLRLASVAAACRDNLPAEISSFVGRETAIAQVAELLSAHRLVTLSGPPGVGKTRLALRVARNLGSYFPDGIWPVELAALAEAGLVPADDQAARRHHHPPPGEWQHAAPQRSGRAGP